MSLLRMQLNNMHFGQIALRFCVLMACVFDSNRAVCGAFQRHNATDLQEEKVVVQSRVLQPPAERPRETL